jgi:hypothetical protein
MPSLDNVKKVVNFVSPQNVEHKIIETNEMDPYDPLPRKKSRKRKAR